MSNAPYVKAIVEFEQGRNSGTWYATAKQYPSIVGSGKTKPDALADFMDQALMLDPEQGLEISLAAVMAQYMNDLPLDGDDA